MRTAALILFSLILAMSVTACDMLESENNNGEDGSTQNAVTNDQNVQEEGVDDLLQDASESSEPESDASVEDDSARDAADELMDDGSGDLAAMVDGTPIALGEFQQQAFDTQRFYVEQGLDPNSEEGQRQLLYLRRQVLDDMINQTLIEMSATELGVAASDEEVEERLQTYYDEFGTGDELEAALAEVGTTFDEIEEMERSSIIGQKMLDEITADVPTTARFVHARHILCNSEEDCDAALARLDSGESFEDVAKDLSEDAASAERGGDLDWITLGMLPSQQMEDEIFSLPVGQRSGVVLTDFGYHVIEVVDEDGARDLSEEQRYTLREKRLMEWLRDRRAASDIVIYIEDLKNLSQQ
jgi:parvulin-like peptidyl-prolyl isomerase